MKITSVTVCLISIVFLFGCSKRNSDSHSPLSSITLTSIDHQSFSFSETAKNKASVIIFLQPECPFCNSYGRTLRQLDSSLSQQDIKLIGVVAGKNYPENEINAYREKHHLKFPILLDPDFVLKENLNAITTPEAFLLDNKGIVLYRGMIDNWGYEIGKVRAQVTERYLDDAVTAYLQNKPILLDSTKAVGCYIQ